MLFLKIKNFFRAESLKDAYEALTNGGTILGGGAFLHLLDNEVEIAVDLSRLNLNYILEKEDVIEIGSYTTLKEIEDSSILSSYFNGILSKAASVIAGVQVRNIATIGGCIGGCYGFSDILTCLLALDAKVQLYNRGIVSMEEFIENKDTKDIIVKVIIKKDEKKASFLSMRNSYTDFSMLNVAVSNLKGGIKIAVGARPLVASYAYKAMDYLKENGLNDETIKRAGEIARDTLNFGSDIRASSEYRKELCSVLVRRGLEEVI
ncbi:FAD binding domain-containing protein [Caloramator sp. E03]|uniref:FAD binding domain-containing protein n=1 Tax=Caloramator sp. E03 TaxID=2576307 RepID=UPI001FA9E2A0|nr:FAD binding domain-containing protein [Caloramator sp. E03]